MSRTWWIIISTTTIIIIALLLSVRAGGDNERTFQELPHSALQFPALPPISVPGGLLTAPEPGAMAGVSAMPPEHGRQEAGTVAASSTPPALSASTHDTPPLVEQAAPVGEAGEDVLASRAWIYQAIIEREKAVQRTAMVARLTAYMTGHQHVQGLIDLAPLMVDLAEQTGNDFRICSVTANEESSGGRVCFRPFNPFGMHGHDFASWEEAVRAYFATITGYGYGGDVWRIAWYYNDGGTDSAKARNYAGNITRAVQGI